jgi:hypothetical protein
MRMCMPRAHIATCLQGVASLFVVQPTWTLHEPATPDIFPNFIVQQEDMPPADLMPESPASTVGAADSPLFDEDYVSQEEPER